MEWYFLKNVKYWACSYCFSCLILVPFKVHFIPSVSMRSNMKDTGTLQVWSGWRTTCLYLDPEVWAQITCDLFLFIWSSTVPGNTRTFFGSNKKVCNYLVNFSEAVGVWVLCWWGLKLNSFQKPWRVQSKGETIKWLVLYSHQP